MKNLNMDSYNYNKIIENGDGYNPLAIQYSAASNDPTSIFDTDRTSRWTFVTLPRDPSEEKAEPIELVCSDLQSIVEQIKESKHAGRKEQISPVQPYRIRLVMSITNPRTTDADEKLFPIPCSQSAFEEIFEQFLLPKPYLETLRRGVTIFLQFPRGYNEHLSEAEAFLFHNTNSRYRNFGAAISFQPKERLTNIFIHGLIKEEVYDLVSELEVCSDYYAFPTIVPILLLEYRLDIATINTQWIFRTIQDIERQTGLDPGWSNTVPVFTSDSIDITEIKYTDLTKHMTAISARLAHYRLVCKVHGNTPSVLNTINCRLIESARSAEKLNLLKCEIFLQARMRNLEEYMKANLTLIEHLEKRTHHVRDTLFSFVAQRDNIINLQIAKQGALDSKATQLLARVTSVDSAAVRYIALITFCFLPATFLATFFSTSFVTFSYSTSLSPKVSPWVWVYFVTTTFVTVTVYGGWWEKSRNQEKAIDEDIRKIYGSDGNV